ncbi:Olfactory receptor 502, partial [Galemys pyrenaicus]
MGRRAAGHPGHVAQTTALDQVSRLSHDTPTVRGSCCAPISNTKLSSDTRLDRAGREGEGSEDVSPALVLGGHDRAAHRSLSRHRSWSQSRHPLHETWAEMRQGLHGRSSSKSCEAETLAVNGRSQRLQAPADLTEALGPPLPSRLGRTGVFVAPWRVSAGRPQELCRERQEALWSLKKGTDSGNLWATSRVTGGEGSCLLPRVSRVSALGRGLQPRAVPRACKLATLEHPPLRAHVVLGSSTRYPFAASARRTPCMSASLPVEHTHSCALSVLQDTHVSTHSPQRMKASHNLKVDLATPALDFPYGPHPPTLRQALPCGGSTVGATASHSCLVPREVQADILTQTCSQSQRWHGGPQGNMQPPLPPTVPGVSVVCHEFTQCPESVFSETGARPRSGSGAASDPPPARATELRWDGGWDQPTMGSTGEVPRLQLQEAGWAPAVALLMPRRVLCKEQAELEQRPWAPPPCLHLLMELDSALLVVISGFGPKSCSTFRGLTTRTPMGAAPEAINQTRRAISGRLMFQLGKADKCKYLMSIGFFCLHILKSTAGIYDFMDFLQGVWLPTPVQPLLLKVPCAANTPLSSGIPEAATCPPGTLAYSDLHCLMDSLGAGNHTAVTGFILLGLTDDPMLQVILFTIILCIYLVTISGNLSTIILIRISSQLHHPIHLALADIGYSSSVTPNMLINFLVERNMISYRGCGIQLGSAVFFGTAECFLLAAMAYDCFMAICSPCSTPPRCPHQCVSSGFLNASSFTISFFSLFFCGPNEVNHFFCDFAPLVELSCSDVSIPAVVPSFTAGSIIVVTVCVIGVSYIYILITILKMCSTEGRHKAFPTCTSHLTAVTLFYGTITFIYVMPKSSYSTDQNKVISVFYMVVIPMLNPIIYSLRNNEI